MVPNPISMLTAPFGAYMEWGTPFGNPLPPCHPTMRRRMTWNEIRARNPERMKAHLENLNRAHREGAMAREGRLRPLVGIMPDREMASWELRDELAQAWEDVYGEEITSKFAWLEVRFGIRRGLFRLTPSGRYAIMSPHGRHDSWRETTQEGMDGLREGTHGGEAA